MGYRTIQNIRKWLGVFRRVFSCCIFNSIVNECLPYVSKRLLTDQDKLGPALTTFVFGPEKSNSNRIVDYQRVEQLVEGFSEYTLSSSGALIGREDLSKAEMLENAAESFLDLVFAEQETPLQAIFLEQTAKIVSAGGRTLFAQVRDRSGVLPTGRSVLGSIIDPIGLWRTSPLVTPSELDCQTVETMEKLVDLVRRQIQQSPTAAFKLSDLSREERLAFASSLVRKFWNRRQEVAATSTRFARALLHQASLSLEQTERNPLPKREVPNPLVATPARAKRPESQRLIGARNLLRSLEVRK